ncbi:MAG: cysteine desulfurase [Acidobacteria bacterium]|nr:cysteine desulfurase [Candidatus Sulfomarinibacter kjeldsenii]
MSFIYLDYNATTPIDPRVAEAMAPFLSSGFGNPSSIHVEGRRAKLALEGARERVARCLGCNSGEVVFTSGGTESNNLAIRGLVEARGGGHVITSAVEHPAILEVVIGLEIEGRIALTIVGVDKFGRVDPGAVAAALRNDTVLVSLMLANNEVGTLQPVREVAALCRQHGVAVHSDAAQAVGKVPVNVVDLGVDLLSVAGHKLYAPKGVGALYVREGVEIMPQIRGAGHERGRRAGTENVLLAAGLGTACELAQHETEKEQQSLASLRNRLAAGLRTGCEDIVEHGHPEHRLPNTLSVALPGQDANGLVGELAEDLAASAGSACHSGATMISYVLQAMGVEPELARATIRLSVGRFTTEEEIDRAVELILAKVKG